jgi:hypothetical protein
VPATRTRRTQQRLGEMTKRQTITADNFTARLCQEILNKNMSRDDGGYMDLNLRPVSGYHDAYRSVEIVRGDLTYTVEILVRRNDKD